MYLRCAGCGTSTRVWPADQSVTCESCGRRAPLGRAKELGTTSDERFRRARDFAREKRIDLASAYSVLLGILPIEKALPIHIDDSYDRAFNDAIDEGFMTVHQAIERGDRVVYASTLQQKHGFTMDRAFLVADNRMSLSEALALQAAGVFPTTEKDRRGTRTLLGIVQVTVAVAIAGAGMFVMLRPKEPPPPPLNTVATDASSRARKATAEITSPAPPEIVAFRTDADGRVIEVSGPDPKTVLVNLCSHAQFARTLSPIAVAPAVPPSTGARLGFVRDITDPTAQRCIAIYRDSRTGRWSAGNGREPLEIQRAPTLPPGTVMLPL